MRQGENQVKTNQINPLADLADKIKTCATESDWLQSKAITGNLLVGGLVRCVFKQNLPVNTGTIIVTIFTLLINYICFI